MKSTLYIYCTLLVVMLLTACAKSGTLSGGPIDETEPRVVAEGSFKTGTTMYADDRIELLFNEYIQLNSPTRTVSISPPTQYNPRITTRGKKMTIKWHRKEKLRDDITYRIVMDGTVGDYTENNKIEELVYVFSTGERIDSMALGGQLLFTDEEKKPRLLALYDRDAPQDSFIVHNKPLYYIYSDADGKFQFENIKEGRYHVISIHDKNRNLKYDPINEEVGFLDTMVTIDGMDNDITLLEMPLDLSQKMVDRASTKYGYAHIDMLLPIDTFYKIEVLENADVQYATEEKRIKLWYGDSLDRVRIRLGMDTILLKLASRDTNTIHSDKLSLDMAEKYFVSDGSWSMNFSAPIDTIVRDSIYINDSIELPPDIELYAEVNRLNVSGLGADSVYLTFKSGALVNHLGSTNDSLVVTAIGWHRDSLPMPRVLITGLDTAHAYIVHMRKGYENITSSTISASSIRDTLLVDLPRILPSEYTLEIIEDVNKDGVWTNGSYFTQTQAERRRIEEITISSENAESIINFGLTSISETQPKDDNTDKRE